MNKYLKASTNPLDDLQSVAYAGQSLQNRMYKSGYEQHFELLPVLEDGDPLLQLKLMATRAAMDDLAVKLAIDPWTPTLQPLVGGFNRTVLALEQPQPTEAGLKEGAEIVVSRWGDGFTSPVHGHADGYLYEQLLQGMMRVNTYRVVDAINRIARPVETIIYKDFANIANVYTPQQQHNRSALLHNFTSIGYSVALHYLPEHTRDGRDNRFDVEYFGVDILFEPSDFKQLSAQEGIEQLRIGDVALVRSGNVPEYGDHFIVITGKPILKEHGLRPQDFAIHAPNMGGVLRHYTPIMGLTLLKLEEDMAQKFRDFYGITIVNGEVKKAI